jgi:hypothetical protein
VGRKVWPLSLLNSTLVIDPIPDQALPVMV